MNEGRAAAEPILRLILAAQLIDGTGRPPLQDAAILVRDERIELVGPRAQLLAELQLDLERADRGTGRGGGHIGVGETAGSASPGEGTLLMGSGAGAAQRQGAGGVTWVSSSARGPVQVVDLGAATLLPGLMDVHVHLDGARTYQADPAVTHDLQVLRAAEDARRLLNAGYTTVRDAGSRIALSLREAIREGTAPGPRIFAAGPIISQTGGHADVHYLPLEEALSRGHSLLADGPDQCRRAVRIAVREGADLIKICTTGGVGSQKDSQHDAHFTSAEIEAIVDEAHRLGRRVAAHAQGAAGVKNALRAGVDSIEHGYFLDEEAVRLFRERGAGGAGGGAGAGAGRGAGAGAGAGGGAGAGAGAGAGQAGNPVGSIAWYVPTLALAEVYKKALDNPFDMPEWRLRKQREAFDAMRRSFEMAVEAGLPIATGSDYAGIPLRRHGDNADEIVTMVAYGMEPLAAIRAATLNAAAVIGIEQEVGSVEAGKLADLVAIREDPLARITALKDGVAWVMQAGRTVAGADVLASV